MQGMLMLSFFWILVAMIHVYFLIVLYSLYQVLDFEEGDQRNCHQSAASHGYSPCNEPESFNNVEKGYQTAEFQGP